MAVPQQDIKAADLAAEVAAMVGSGRVHAHYSAGEDLMRLHLTRRLLSIDVTNSQAGRLPSAERDVVLTRMARAGAAWLRTRDLLTPGTLISVGLSREIDLRLVSWSWGVAGRSFWIDASGEITSQEPPAPSG